MIEMEREGENEKHPHGVTKQGEGKYAEKKKMRKITQKCMQRSNHPGGRRWFDLNSSKIRMQQCTSSVDVEDNKRRNARWWGGEKTGGRRGWEKMNLNYIKNSRLILRVVLFCALQHTFHFPSSNPLTTGLSISSVTAIRPVESPPNWRHWMSRRKPRAKQKKNGRKNGNAERFAVVVAAVVVSWAQLFLCLP